MKRTTTLLSATLVALALPLTAQAANPGENFLTNWDYDGDGTVTLEDVLTRRGDLFDGFDENEDGVLSPEELADHNAMRDAMRDAQERPDRAGGQGMGQGGQGSGQRGMGQGGQGFGGRGMGRGGQGGQGMMPPQGFNPGYGYGQPQQGWGMAPQQGWGYGPGMMGGPQGFGPQGFGPQGFDPQGFAPQGYGQPGFPPQGFGPGQGFAPDGQAGPSSQPQQGLALDADNDSRITRDEFVSAGEAFFSRFDRTGDGEVTAEDFGPNRR